MSITTNGLLPGHYSAREAQASGMVSEQARCTPAEAFVLMKQRALDDDVSLSHIASAVLARTMRFGNKRWPNRSS